MQKLIITRETYKSHKQYSIYIKEILMHIAKSDDVYLSSRKNARCINLSNKQLKYFKAIFNLYKKIDFLLATPRKLKDLIQKENEICTNQLHWKTRPKKINKILVKIFGYDQGFSKGKIIHLKTIQDQTDTSKFKYIIQYSDHLPSNNYKWGAAKFLSSLNVKYCVYCNVGGPLEWDINKNKHSHLDHFYSKSDYPFLALTLRNLIPTCERCNVSEKGTQELPPNALNPYEGSFHESEIFHLQPLNDPNKLTIDTMINGFNKVRGKNYTINDLLLDPIPNAPLGQNADKLATFFKIIAKYQEINKDNDEINKYVIDEIYYFNKFHDKMITNLLLRLTPNERKINFYSQNPIFFIKESEINKIRFGKLIIDLCKEVGIR